jgi:hypothetical protein
MKTVRICLVLLFASALALAADSKMPAKPNYVAHLSGSNEVPPIQVKARGEADFYLSKNGKELRYKLTVQDIEDVTMAHLHVGSANQNGDHIVWLYPSTQKPKIIAGKYSGTLAEGSITAANFMGPMKGKSLRDLIEKIKAGDIYVNVHSKEHPDGDIRGQLTS